MTEIQELQLRVDTAKKMFDIAEQDLERAKKELWEKYQLESHSVEERFEFWYQNAAKQDHSWIRHVYTRNKKELFGYDAFIHCEKYQTIDIEEVYERLAEEIEAIKQDEEKGCEGILASANCDLEDIHDWMEELMKINFGSMTYDW
jgi:tRNA U34 5-carboxymethylaminomethyl modifying enzyme MnmG/GidA